jgi:hypothetical protein
MSNSSFGNLGDQINLQVKLSEANTNANTITSYPFYFYFLISKKFYSKKLDVHKACTQSKVTNLNLNYQMLKKLKTLLQKEKK